MQNHFQQFLFFFIKMAYVTEPKTHYNLQIASILISQQKGAR